MAKLNPNGIPEWAISIGGIGADRAFNVEQTPEGGIYIAGDFADTITWSGQSMVSYGKQDGFIIRLDSDGALLWLRNIGGPEGETVNGLTAVSDGGVYVTGEFNGTAQFCTASLTSRGGQDAYLARLGSDGSIAWVRQFGSTNSDAGYDVVTARDSTIFLTGFLTETVSFAGQEYVPVGDFEPFVAAYSPTGVELGMQVAEGILDANDNGYGFGMRLATDWAGNVYMGGIIDGGLRFGTTDLQSNPSIGLVNDIFIAKLGDHSLFRPQLDLTPGENGLQVNWSTGWDDWILEFTTNLNDPNSWEIVNKEPVEDNGKKVVTETVQATVLFYRLRLR